MANSISTYTRLYGEKINNVQELVQKKNSRMNTVRITI